MKIGIAFSLKPDDRGGDGPDDRYEEFDRPETVEAIADVIRGEGHDVVLLGDGREFLERVLTGPPDFVFNLAEGQGVGRSREAQVPAVCEMLGIPYSGSDPLTLAAALDKSVARRLLGGRVTLCIPAGALVAPFATREIVEPMLRARFRDDRLYPLIVKPAFEGSSKGIRGDALARDAAEATEIQQRLARDYRQPVLVEQFIEGDEVTVGVVGNEDETDVLGIMRIRPRDTALPFVYSLEVKRDWANRVDYEAPARLSPQVEEDLIRASHEVYRALGCRDVARIDFRVKDGDPYFIEANPLPGLAPVTSDLVILAEGYGIGHSDLIRRILDSALRRVGLAPHETVSP